MSYLTEEVIIIGAGISGIGASHYLSKFNISHMVLEKRNDVGGMWSSHKWPGVRCDSDIVKYSFSFHPFLSDKRLVEGEAIQSYLKEVSVKSGIIDKIRFGISVIKIDFDSEKCIWNVHTDKGIFKSRFVINANGYFSETPHIPKFVNSEKFQGEIRHIFDVNQKDNQEYKNKKVLLIGSGASAICAIPVLCRDCLSLTVLQRSPSYIYEENNEISIFISVAQKLFRKNFGFPLKVLRYFMQLKDDIVFVVFRRWPWIGRLFFKYHWKDTVDQKTYAEQFTPRYDPWEQRIPVSIGLKETVKNNEFNLITGEIASFTHTGAIFKSGKEIGFDLCILATGIDLQFFKFDIYLDHEQVDTRGINYYKGMMMGGIPNFFQPVGTFHTSWTQRTEMVSNLVAKIIAYMRRHKLESVGISRRNVVNATSITPNYVTRNISQLPVLYGSLELPSIDMFLSYRFRVSEFNFSGKDMSQNS